MTPPKLDLQGMLQNHHDNNIKFSTVHKDCFNAENKNKVEHRITRELWTKT